MKKGYTFIEVMVSILIVGILGTVGMPKIFGLIAKAKEEEPSTPPQVDEPETPPQTEQPETPATDNEDKDKEKKRQVRQEDC